MTKTLWKETLGIWAFGFLKIPLVWWLKPRIMEIDNSHCVLMMPFRRRTKNHVGSMYFGAICIGAELAPGALTIHLFKQQKTKFTFVFKAFHAEFLQRCESDVYFSFTQGDVIEKAIKQAELTHERQNVSLNISATCPATSGDKQVALFAITISIKALQPKGNHP